VVLGQVSSCPARYSVPFGSSLSAALAGIGDDP